MNGQWEGKGHIWSTHHRVWIFYRPFVALEDSSEYANGSGVLRIR